MEKNTKPIKVRTRFAPSPTGYLHVGVTRSALFSYLFAKINGGDFVLRIEDTDRERLVPDSLDDIKDSLSWLGLKWDEGPIIQSERTDIYKKHAQKLIEKEEAYYCFCGVERLEQLRKDQTAKKMPPMYDGKCSGLPKEDVEKKITDGEKFVVRQKVSKEGITHFNDLIRGNVKFENKFLDDSVLLKSDGYPTYHLANVVDDHLMEITHVIRAEEWLPSTPKHILLYKSFGWKMPEFAHLPMVLGSDRSKLSKRHGATSVNDYRNQGYLPEAMINFMVFLGWNPGTEEEIFSLEELTKRFSLERVGKAGAIFNIERLDWVNGCYIKKFDLDKLTKLSIPFLIREKLVKKTSDEKFESKAGFLDFEYIKKVVALERERIKKLADLPKLIDFFFQDTLEYDASLLVWKKSSREETKKHLGLLKEYIESIEGSDFNKNILESKIKEWIEENSLGVGDTLWPMRVALSGKDKSPGPFEIAEVLGKKKVLERLKRGIEKLE